MTGTPLDVAERRQPEQLTFDPATRELSLGSCTAAIATGGGNRAVLDAFVTIVTTCRGVRPNQLVDVRDSDMDALCEALDLDSTDLRHQLERALGLSPALSTRLLSNLRQRRLMVRMAAAAAGVAMVGTLGAAAVAPPASAQASAGKITIEQPIIDGPLTVDENGVGLIPPVEVNADGTVLIPPVQVDQAPAPDVGATPGA